MAKRQIAITVDNEILKSFDSEYKNRSQKIEELMENSIIEGNDVDKLEKELENIRDEKDYLDQRQKALEDKLRKLKEGIEKEEIVQEFVSDQVEKFERDYPERWKSFDQFWDELGTGIMNKAESDGVNFDSVDLKPKIKEEIEKEI